MAGPDFGDTIMEGAIAPETQVQEPIKDKSSLYLAEGVSNVLGDVGSVFGGILKGQQQDAENSVLNDYRQRIVELADWVDQGGSRDAARTRGRKIYLDAVSNNPGLAGEIDKLHSTLLSENGIGHIIQTGDEQQEREIKLADSALAAGWVDENGNPDVNGYQSYQASVRNAETIKRDIEVRTAQRGEIAAVDKLKLQGAIHDMASSGYPWVEHQVQNAAKLIETNPTPENIATVLETLDATVNAQLNQFTTASGGEDISYIVEPMKQLVTTLKDLVSKKASTETINAAIANIQAKNKLMLISDPEVAEAVAFSELFGSAAGPLLDKQGTKIATKIFGDNSMPYDPESDSNPKPGDVIGQEGDIKTYFDALGLDMEGALTTPTAGKDTEVGNQITNILRSLSKYKGDNVKDYRNLIDFFASPVAAKWAGGGKLIIPENVKTEAAGVIKDQYFDVLIPVVEDSWINMKVNTVNVPMRYGMAPSTPISEVIEPIWNGTSVVFQAKAEYANSPHIQAQVSQLNSGPSSIAVPLNTLIRAQAHMEGNTDYTKQWELFGPRLFDMEDDNELDSNKGTVEDFNLVMPSSTKQAAFDEPPLTGGGVEYIGDVDMGDYLSKIRAAESGGNDSADNPLSTAYGRYQFTDGTWKGMVQRYPDILTLEGIADGDQQEMAIRLFTDENARHLTIRSIPVNNATLYAAHFLGAKGSVPVLTAEDDEMMANLVSGAAMKSNPFLDGWTVGDFKKWLKKKVG